MPDEQELSEGEVSDGMSDNEQDYDDDDMDDKPAEQRASSEGAGEGGAVKAKYNPKDPSRPRRKKARRACFACQRAHLTCGDERPCQRCIKRNLADQCQDGVRKKAKYLHDAPPEALRPVLGPNFNGANPPPGRSSGHRQPSSAGSEATSSVGPLFPGSSSTGAFGAYGSGQTSVAGLPDAMPFANQQSPVSPGFPRTTNMTVPQVSGDMSNLSQAFFDPSNPALFNFNPDLLDFSNQYGALEFGMLGHMASGTAETPPREPSVSQHSQQGTGDVSYGSAATLLGTSTPTLSNAYDTNGMMGFGFGINASSNGLYAQDNLQHGLPHAFAVPAGPASLQSPSAESSPQATPGFNFDGSPTSASYTTAPTQGQASSVSASGGAPQSRSNTSRPSRPPAIHRPFPANILGSKRTRDSSYVYDRVTEPYTYVNAFHTLIALLKERFSSNQILRIAKALASIRPSFISCTRTLNRTDLVFMEKCFQRMLLEYEDFMLQCSAPTLVCRRTGEVAAVNKEFIALTGWTKGVLLGIEPNLNANTGAAGSADTSGQAGLTTPRLKAETDEHDHGHEDDDDDVKPGAKSAGDKDGNSVAAASSKPRPIFIAEMMDDDSVIDFYNDYASLAFGDSRGHVVRKCRLLKYRPAQSLDSAARGAAGGAGGEEDGKRGVGTSRPGIGGGPVHKRSSILSSRVTRIDGEHGISRFAKDGKLECSYTWTIKRDTFDIPMMIVMNFLPCYYPDQEPHQLAV